MPRLTKKQPTRRRPAFDWSMFTDGKARVCIAGEDFHCGKIPFQQLAAAAARRRKMLVATESDGENLIVQFFPKEGGR